jgi:hypothetical protein
MAAVPLALLFSPYRVRVLIPLAACRAPRREWNHAGHALDSRCRP